MAFGFASCTQKNVQNNASQAHAQGVSSFSANDKSTIASSLYETVSEQQKSTKASINTSAQSSSSKKKTSTQSQTKAKAQQPSKKSSKKSGKKSNAATTTSPQSSAPASEKTQREYCTISVECKSILSNMDKLKAGHESFVPENGIIIAKKQYEISAGDTAFDILKKACADSSVSLESSYSSVFQTYYVEGINQLHEFDCGNESGWKYSVNSVNPNYGASKYKLKNNDSIVFYYVCSQ